MKDRVERHQKERGPEWTTWEEPLAASASIKKLSEEASVIILDCITLWLNNLLMQGETEASIRIKVQELIDACNQATCPVIIITNEIGGGIIPVNAMSRQFRDIAGITNQTLARDFSKVVHLVSGIPVTIKPQATNSPDETQTDTSDAPHAFPQTKKNGVYDAIYKRRDMRHFLPDPVDPAVLGRILDAAHHAGSVGFMQPWNFIVIDDPEVKKKVARNFSQANEAASKNYSGAKKDLYQSLKLEGITASPINLCVTCDSERNGPHVLGRNSISETDQFSACCAVQNLWLAARAEGIAVGWVSILSPDQLKKDLNLPDHVFPIAYLCIGHTDSFYKKPMLEEKGWAKRLALKQLVYYNQWLGGPGNFKVVLPPTSK